MTAEAPRILVVDDDAAFGGMIVDTLVEKGCVALWAGTPREALRVLSEDAFSVAIVDLVMPEMGGIQLAERIRDLSPDTQTVILTGRGDLESAVEGIRHGVFDYLQKHEIDHARLWRAVEAAVDRSKLLQENRELVDALADSNRLLAALHASSAGIAGEAHLDRLLSRAVAAAKETTGATAGRVILFDRGPGGEIVVGVALGDGAETLPGMRLRPGEGLATLAFEKDEAVAVKEPRSHPAFSPRLDDLPNAGAGLLAAPLRHRSVSGALVVGRSTRPFTEPETEALSVLARQMAVSADNARQQERALNFFTHTSDILVDFVEAIDVTMPGHSRGVAAVSDMITRRLGLDDAQRRAIHFGALLHDIGKTRLAPETLKLESLGDESWTKVRAHPGLGLEILRPIAWWEDTLAVVHSHHERWDGAGYPRGLRGEEIPLGARVVAVADAYDAMARPSPHRRPTLAGGPAAEIEAGSGSQFDPRIVRLFLADLREHGDPRVVRR